MHSPFIPAWFDDAGLTPTQFRVLAHLHRRAGKKGRCWPGASSIAKACRISEDSLWPAVKCLEDRGYLRREKRRYNSNEYVLLSPDVTPSIPVTLSPPETGERSLESEGSESPAKAQGQSLESSGCKGIERKVQKESNQRKGVCEPTHSTTWPSSLSDSAKAELAEEVRAKPEVLDKAYLAFRAAKLTYRDPAPSSDDEAFALFEVWFNTSKSAKKFRAIGEDWDDAKRRFQGHGPSMLEPKGWREFVAHEFGTGGATDGKQWGELDRVQQGQIVNGIAAWNRKRRSAFAEPQPWESAA